MVGSIALWLADLRLRDFRNYAVADLSFRPGVTLMVGPNAQGKSNLVEAIYTAALGRSPRVGRDIEVIRFGQDRAYVRAGVQGTRAHNLEVAFDRTTGARRIRVNGVSATRGQLLGRCAVVLAGSLDDELVRGAPAHRRRLMDAALSQVSPSYFFALTRYTRVLRQRNQLLRAAADARTLAPWDDQLVDLGAVVTTRRREFVARLAVGAAERHARLAGGAERLRVVYVCAAGEGEERAALRRALDAGRGDDLRRGTTHVGPHRDDVLFTVNGVDVRMFGSRGEHHTVALSVRLAEVDQLRAELGEWPIVLLDDVLAHLDASRQSLLLKEVAGPQVLLTHTERPPAADTPMRVLQVKAGTVLEDSGVSAGGSPS
jgi:DNA replication and repair protein RecF